MNLETILSSLLVTPLLRHQKMSTHLIEAAVIEQSLIAQALEVEPTTNPLTLKTASLVLDTPPETSGSSHERRDVKTSIHHADDELYQRQLEAKGGKEDMSQGGDVYVS